MLVRGASLEPKNPFNHINDSSRGEAKRNLKNNFGRVFETSGEISVEASGGLVTQYLENIDIDVYYSKLLTTLAQKAIHRIHSHGYDTTKNIGGMYGRKAYEATKIFISNQDDDEAAWKLLLLVSELDLISGLVGKKLEKD